MRTINSIIKSPPAVRGSSNAILTPGMPPQTVAQLELDGSCLQQEGVAKGVTIELSIDAPPNAAGVASAGYYIKWTLQFGYGGVNKTKILYTQSGRINVAGDWFRVSAQLILAPAQSAVPNTQAIVSAFIAPAVDGQTRWGTIWNGNTIAFQATNTGSAIYQLSTSACVLWRVNGYRYDAGTQMTYLMLFDQAITPDAGDLPQMVVGAVPANGTYSLDVSLSGRDFFNGLYIAASSTGDVLTLDNTVTIATDCEILSN
jgi:hypothetical protein